MKRGMINRHTTLSHHFVDLALANWIRHKRIADKAHACPGVRGIHNLRTRYADDRIFIEFHLEVDADHTVARRHAMSDRAEIAAQELFPSTVEVTAHLEPASIDDEQLDDRVGPKEG
jgi:ferrous-iron efflux pump FieF